jgi:hypothetical protein
MRRIIHMRRERERETRQREVMVAGANVLIIEKCEHINNISSRYT